jgi:hypothetical protein
VALVSLVCLQVQPRRPWCTQAKPAFSAVVKAYVAMASGCFCDVQAHTAFAAMAANVPLWLYQWCVPAVRRYVLFLANPDPCTALHTSTVNVTPVGCSIHAPLVPPCCTVPAL